MDNLIDIRDRFGFAGFEVGDVDKQQRKAGFPVLVNALQDLADSMNADPTALGLNGTLTLSVSSSARGESGPFYKCEHKLLNFSETTGPHCVAHEWFHAFDHYFHGHQSFSVNGGFASLARKITTLSLYQRTVAVDISMGMDYFRKPREMTARAFESYVEHWLASKGRTNEYLVSPEGQELVYCQGNELQQLKPFIDLAIGQGLAVVANRSRLSA